MNPSGVVSGLSSTEVSGLAAMVWSWTAAFAPRLLAALAILVMGFVFAVWARRGLDRVTLRTHWIDNTIRPFLLGAAQYAIIILVLILVLNQIGIETSSLLAVLGAAGLAVGLALQGTLSNIAAGIMLLWLRPFDVGDYIEVNGQSGTVEETGLFSCTLRSFDGARLFAPNSTIWNFSLKNHRATGGRLIALAISLAPSVPRAHASAALETMHSSDDSFLKEPKPVLFVDSVSSTAVALTWRVWVSNARYSELQRIIVDATTDALVRGGIPIEAIQSISRTVPATADPTKLMDI